jgi:hypothetical protein
VPRSSLAAPGGRAANHAEGGGRVVALIARCEEGTERRADAARPREAA